MKKQVVTAKFLLLAAMSLLAWAARGGTRSGGNTVITADIINGGGTRVTSVLYRIDASLDAFGGTVAGGSPVETLKSGFAGQLTETTNIAISATPWIMMEFSSAQLDGLARLDDGTVTVLNGSDVKWMPATFPLVTITPGGAITSAAVYADSSGAVTGAYLGVAGAVAILVLDVYPDNYGIYATDQIPDSWQVRYYGTNNPSGLASAIASNRQTNLDNYIADLVPTNPASKFVIITTSNGPTSRLVSFPSSSNRVYMLKWSTNLMNGTWSDIAGQTPVDGSGSVMTLSDTNSTPSRFYRVGVALPIL